MTTAEQIADLHLRCSAGYKQACELMCIIHQPFKEADGWHVKYIFLDDSSICI